MHFIKPVYLPNKRGGCSFNTKKSDKVQMGKPNFNQKKKKEKKSAKTKIKY